MADKYSLLYSSNLVTYALHCSKSWILVHMTHSITSFVSLARLFSLESSSNWIPSVSSHLSLLLKLFLSLSFLSVCWSTVSEECNGSLTSSFSSSTKLMKPAKPGSLAWFFYVNCTLLFHQLTTEISSFEITFSIPSHLLVLLVVIFQFLNIMSTESCEDHHIVSLS